MPSHNVGLLIPPSSRLNNSSDDHNSVLSAPSPPTMLTTCSILPARPACFATRTCLSIVWIDLTLPHALNGEDVSALAGCHGCPCRGTISMWVTDVQIVGYQNHTFRKEIYDIDDLSSHDLSPPPGAMTSSWCNSAVKTAATWIVEFHQSIAPTFIASALRDSKLPTLKGDSHGEANIILNCINRHAVTCVSM